jgi:hypothetical protein
MNRMMLFSVDCHAEERISAPNREKVDVLMTVELGR